MPILRTVFYWGVALALGGVGPAAVAREEFLPLTENRAIAIAVPDGFSYKAGANAKGELGIVLGNQDGSMSLTVTFKPDAENEYRQQRARTERMHEEFHSYVAESSEQAMQFAELEPKVGAGTYCVFTDARLKGKPASEYPKGEYLNLTVGVKAWNGVVATFTLFSNGTDSDQYRALLRVLRESLHEKLPPLR
jgi:hypothetical protein